MADWFAGLPANRVRRILPAENWQNSVLFLVSFMHVWYVDKKNGAEFECPP